MQDAEAASGGGRFIRTEFTLMHGRNIQGQPSYIAPLGSAAIQTTMKEAKCSSAPLKAARRAGDK